MLHLIEEKRYRCIRTWNGCEEVEFKHVKRLDNGYHWLLPKLYVQVQERWHIKSLETVEKELSKQGINYVLIGWNEENYSESLYIQKICSWNDPLPQL